MKKSSMHQIDMPRKTGWVILVVLFFILSFADTSQTSAQQGDIYIGQQVEVVTGGQNLNLRQEPGTSFDVVARLPPGTVMTVIDGPENAKNYAWWKLQGDLGQGWAAENFLRPVTTQMTPSSSSSLCESQNTTFEGVQLCTRDAGKTHVVIIDLADPHVRFETIMANDAKSVNTTNVELVENMVKRYPGAVAAINADYFGAGHHGPEGLTIKNSVRFDGSGNGDNDNGAVNRSSLVIGKGHLDDGQSPITVDITRLENDKQAIDFDAFYNSVGGGPQVFFDGLWYWKRGMGDVHNTGCATSNRNDMINGECFLNTGEWDLPEKMWTTVGVTSDNKMVWVISHYPKVKPTLEAFSTQEAIKLDGGGSSQLWFSGNTIIPSNRKVADSLLVFYINSFEVIESPEWPVIVAGESMQVNITLKNAGADTWTTNNYKFIGQSGILGLEKTELSLARDVKPGETITFSWSTPQINNWSVYTTKWNMTVNEREFPDAPVVVRVVVIPAEIAEKRAELEGKIKQWLNDKREDIEQLILQWIKEQIEGAWNRFLNWLKNQGVPCIGSVWLPVITLTVYSVNHYRRR